MLVFINTLLVIKVSPKHYIDVCFTVSTQDEMYIQTWRIPTFTFSNTQACSQVIDKRKLREILDIGIVLYLFMIWLRIGTTVRDVFHENQVYTQYY